MGLIISSNMKCVECKDEGWLFRTKDRNYMEYVESGQCFLIEVEYGVGIKYIYFNTIKTIPNAVKLTNSQKEIIRERLVRALDVMKMNYEIC